MIFIKYLSHFSSFLFSLNPNQSIYQSILSSIFSWFHIKGKDSTKQQNNHTKIISFFLAQLNLWSLLWSLDTFYLSHPVLCIFLCNLKLIILSLRLISSSSPHQNVSASLQHPKTPPSTLQSSVTLVEQFQRLLLWFLLIQLHPFSLAVQIHEYFLLFHYLNYNNCNTNLVFLQSVFFLQHQLP